MAALLLPQHDIADIVFAQELGRYNVRYIVLGQQETLYLRKNWAANWGSVVV